MMHHIRPWQILRSVPSRDLKQLCDEKGNPKLPEQGKGEHNALADACWNMKAYEFLERWEKP